MSKIDYSTTLFYKEADFGMEYLLIIKLHFLIRRNLKLGESELQ